MTYIDDYKFTRCRTLGHAWDHTEADRKPEFGWYLALRCTECGMLRLDTVGVHGELLGRRYTRPATYRAAKQSRSDWRASYMAQLVADFPRPKTLMEVFAEEVGEELGKVLQGDDDVIEILGRESA